MRTVGRVQAAANVKPVAASCRVCHGFVAAHTRAAFTAFEERHLADCGPASVVVGGSVDELLDLPPY